METTIGIIFKISVVLFSAIIHEIAHGAIALRLGDATAKMAGRLTLNPLRHLDPFGSVILPGVMAFLGYPPFGWAKPVPYNPYNFKDSRKGSLAVGLAGPLTNLSIAAIFAVIIRVMVATGNAGYGGGAVVVLFFTIMLINLILGWFNLVPIPPLDGSKVLFYFFPRLEPLMMRYGPFVFIFLVFLIAPTLIEPLIGLSLNITMDPETIKAIAPFLDKFRYFFA